MPEIAKYLSTAEVANYLGVGVSTVDVYEIKRLDSDYFDAEV